MRFIGRALLALVLLVVVAVLVALGYRSWRQHENSVALAITSPNGIDEQRYVGINGLAEYITIRGEDRDNPVLLMLAGGPGNTLVPLSAVFRPWEKYFTIVQWDQRGAGRTFEASGANGQGKLTIAQMVADGVTLSEFLRTYLHKHKIVLLGDSWGSTLGVRMAKSRPEYFAAYVGTGQVAGKEDKEEFLYAALMKKVVAARDDASLARLKKIGAPPYKSQADLLVERDVSEGYDTEAERNLRSKMTPIVLFAPDFTLRDIYTMELYGNFASNAMYKELITYDANKLGPDFAVPMFVFNGELDAITPAILAERWFATIRAPKKAFVIMKGGGHSVLLTMSDAFLHELVTRVRPLAVEH